MVTSTGASYVGMDVCFNEAAEFNIGCLFSAHTRKSGVVGISGEVSISKHCWLPL